MTESEAKREIAELLTLAEQHEAKARECRRAIGMALGAMRPGRTTAQFHDFVRSMGLTVRSAELHEAMAGIRLAKGNHG